LQEIGKTTTDIRLSEDGESITVRSERDEREVRRSFSLDALAAEATLWQPSLPLQAITIPHLQDASSAWQVQNANGSTSLQAATSATSDSANARSDPQLDVADGTAANQQGDSADNVLSGMSPLRVWMFPQYGILPQGCSVKRYATHVNLYNCVSDESTTWRISQNWVASFNNGLTFTDDSNNKDAAKSNEAAVKNGGNGNADSSKSGASSSSDVAGSMRFVATITNPVTMTFGDQTLPILGVAATHICWIERRSTRQLRSLGRKREHLEMKLLAFPEPEAPFACSQETGAGDASLGERRSEGLSDDCDSPGSSTASSSSSRTRGRERTNSLSLSSEHTYNSLGLVKTLDIPEEVLQNACYILVKPAMGTVTVMLTSNDQYVYHYA
jgi:hypothetical protein